MARALTHAIRARHFRRKAYPTFVGQDQTVAGYSENPSKQAIREWRCEHPPGRLAVAQASYRPLSVSYGTLLLLAPRSE